MGGTKGKPCPRTGGAVPQDVVVQCNGMKGIFHVASFTITCECQVRGFAKQAGQRRVKSFCSG